MLGVYIHIPFCKSICSYCDFCKMYYNYDYAYKYLIELEREIKSRYKGELVDSIYIGGGTPSVLDINLLEYLMNILKIFKLKENYEYTIESNIESIDLDKLILLKNNGVNRISFGVESFDSDNLKLLDRNHTKEMIFDKINITKKYFNNINIDLIYGVTDNIKKVENDISLAINLDIKHISCYSLILEEHTKLMNIDYKSISEDSFYEMYKLINNKLEKNGFNHYEISNYAKVGYESVHNKIYWLNNSYYGFGLSAVSYLNNYRISNTRNLNKYLNSNYILESISEDDNIRRENDLILGLRLIQGINILKYNERNKTNLLNYDIIKKMIDDNKLEIVGNNIRICNDYIYLSNQILSELIGELK